MKPHFAKPELPKSGAVVVAVLEGRKLSPGAQLIDRASGGAIERAIASSRFKGGAEDALTVLAPAGLAASRVPGIGVLLTGMGRDGAEGLLRLRQSGWTTIAQDERTSVVDGMPRAAAEIGAAEHVLPLEAIGPMIVGLVSRRTRER